MQKYADLARRGRSFVVVKQSKPLFRIAPLKDEGRWEEVADFTSIRRGGIQLDELLKRL